MFFCSPVIPLNKEAAESNMVILLAIEGFAGLFCYMYSGP